MRINDFKGYGEHANHRLLVRVTKTQKERIKAMTEASGFKTVANFVRFTLLTPSIDMKLNEILKIVKSLQNKSPHVNVKPL